MPQATRVSTGGGAIYSALCDVTVKGSVIANNSAIRGNGGAVLTTSAGSLRVQGNTVFTSNSAFASGGAIACDECQIIRLNGSTFENNVAGTHGGSVSLVNPMSTRVKISSGSVFRSNTAEDGDGGAVYVAHSSVAEGGDVREAPHCGNSTEYVFGRKSRDGRLGGAIFAIGTKIAFGVGSDRWVIELRGAGDAYCGAASPIQSLHCGSSAHQNMDRMCFPATARLTETTSQRSPCLLDRSLMRTC